MTRIPVFILCSHSHKVWHLMLFDVRMTPPKEPLCAVFVLLCEHTLLFQATCPLQIINSIWISFRALSPFIQDCISTILMFKMTLWNFIQINSSRNHMRWWIWFPASPKKHFHVVNLFSDCHRQASFHLLLRCSVKLSFYALKNVAIICFIKGAENRKPSKKKGAQVFHLKWTGLSTVENFWSSYKYSNVNTGSMVINRLLISPLVNNLPFLNG